MHDKTDAEVIYRTFGISKRYLKQPSAIYIKTERSKFYPNGIQLV
ncbi:MAG: hypothetical protein IPF52_03295 [Saprospiraceae bacterium]|nr:hypothetical protein [Saprospiraceae bacterium]